MKSSGEWRVARTSDLNASRDEKNSEFSSTTGNSTVQNEDVTCSPHDTTGAEKTNTHITGVDFSCSSHDTTGGLEAKVGAAASIAARGVDVIIAKAGTEHARVAIQGKPGYQQYHSYTWIHQEGS